MVPSTKPKQALVTKQVHVDANVDTLVGYLTQEDGSDAEYAKSLIRRGRCFVLANRNGDSFFAPSRFVGYQGNSRYHHERNQAKDGRETNPALDRALGIKCAENATREAEFLTFCAKLGIKPIRIDRKYWDMR